MFQHINGYKKLCLSKESAIANHQLQKFVKETVFPCLPFPLGIKLVLDTEIFTDMQLLLTTSWNDPVVLYIFWLSLITSSKCSETTYQIFQVKIFPAWWRGTLSGNFLLFIFSYHFDLCNPTDEVFSTIYHTVILKKKNSLHNIGVFFSYSDLDSQETFKNTPDMKPASLILISLLRSNWGFSLQSILHLLRFSSSWDY